MVRRPWAKIFAAVTVAVVVALLLLEILLRILIGTGQWKDSGRTWAFYVNTYTGDGFKCTFQESLESHPYMGWMLGPFLPCKRFIRNNRGFGDRHDLPFQRDPELFTLMITGGSVAAQVAFGSGHGRPLNWLEDELNARFRSPNGKPFRVASGAMGGWRMPTEITTAAMFGSQVDAIVSLNGYNEMMNVIINKPIDRPDVWTWYSVQSPLSGVLTLRVMKVLKAFRIAISSTPLLRDSKVLFMAFEGVFGLFSDNKNGGLMGETDAVRHQFSYPADWKPEQIERANIEKWQNYIRTLRATAESLGLKYAQFIQPVPSVDKQLSERELLYAQRKWGEQYLRVIVRPAEDLKREGISVMSLTGVFKDITDMIYSDEIHCAFEDTGDNRGYRIMTKAMATALGQMWKLKPAANAVRAAQ